MGFNKFTYCRKGNAPYSSFDDFKSLAFKIGTEMTTLSGLVIQTVAMDYDESTGVIQIDLISDYLCSISPEDTLGTMIVDDIVKVFYGLNIAFIEVYLIDSEVLEENDDLEEDES